MTKSNFDKKYKVPDTILKAVLFFNYQLRQTYWRALDAMEGNKKNSALNLTGGIDDFDINGALKKFWRENGFVILKRDVPSESIDLVNEAIHKSRQHLESLGQGEKDGFGNTGRISNIHSINRLVFKFILNQRVRRFLQFALNGEPVLWGSLTFQVGTEQPAHADAPFFYTEPTGSFAGVWTALEDIHPDSGPVFYYDKSPLNPLKGKDVLDRHPNLNQLVLEARKGNSNLRNKFYRDLAAKVSDAYTEELINHWVNSGKEKIPVILEKGDTLIWSQWLVHGGLMRTNLKKTRNSIVCHFCTKDSKHWPMQDYFLNSDRLSNIPPQKLPIKICRDGLYLRQYNAQILDWN